MEIQFRHARLAETRCIFKKKRFTAYICQQIDRLDRPVYSFIINTKEVRQNQAHSAMPKIRKNYMMLKLNTFL